MSLPPTVVKRELIRPGTPRVVDATLAIAGIIVCAPLLCIVAVSVRLSSPGPILFRQRRVGRGGVAFTMLKFRTMRVAQHGLQITASGDNRITTMGRWLRQLKLDELPELWNVARGDMSLVGPRPEVPGYVDLSNPKWLDILQARPGITDPVTLILRNEEALLATVSGDRERYYLEILQPYKLDHYGAYLRRRSFGSDVCVILRTLGAIIAPGAITPPDLAAMHGKHRQGTDGPVTPG